MTYWKPLLLIIVLIAISQTTMAQTTEQPNDCPTVVRTAITLTGQRCEDTDLNQICYGHLVLDAQPRTGLVNFGFDEPGDIVDVVEVQSLRLSAFDADAGRWGVVMMQIEAKLAQQADNNPEVQILLFGDAELNDATRFLPGQANEPAIVRAQPSTSSRMLTSLNTEDEITANGRLQDNSWLRINLSDHNGWVRSDLITLDGDVESLAAVAAANLNDDVLAQFGPMQAFYFRAGANDAPCAQAPNSGLLIQTPEGVAAISIWLDEVVIEMQATAYVQAQPDGELTINILEGEARVTANDDTRTVVSGMQINVPLDSDLTAADVPSDPSPYDVEVLQSLPLELLDRPVDVPAPRTQPAGVPLAGQWNFAWDTAQLTCPDGTNVPFESTGAPSVLTVESESLTWNAARYTRSTPGIYRANYVDSSGNLHQDTLQVIAADRIIGEKVLDLISPVCTLNVGFQLQLASVAGVEE